MSDGFLGEIRMFSGNFAPVKWAQCDGQYLSVSENEALFSLLDTTFGGDGRTNFALPDFRGRIPMHCGQGPGISRSYGQGERGGVETVTLTSAQMPQHAHLVAVNSSDGTSDDPTGSVFANSDNDKAMLYNQEAPDVALSSTSLLATGGSQSHNNMMPFLVLNFVICINGIYPSRN